jgi:putative tricarboxylic transport membrane protein
VVDRILGGIFVLAAAIGIWHIETLDVPFAADPVGPRVFPVIICGLLGLCGAVLVVRPRPNEPWTGDRLPPLMIVAASLIYPLLLLPLGFIVATALLCFVGSLAFKARLLPAAVSAVATSVSFYLLLDRLLDLPLPRGPLGI